MKTVFIRLKKHPRTKNPAGFIAAICVPWENRQRRIFPRTHSLRQSFRMSGTGDPWGRCMAWRFALADYCLTHNLPTPADYHPSPFGADTTVWEYQEIIRCRPVPATVARFVALLERLGKILEAGGRDY